VVRDADPLPALTALRGPGLRVLAADARGEHSLDSIDPSRPTAWLFGGEVHGLPAALAGAADAGCG
jgi:TrmH family RNA methyltransferase